MTLMLSLRSVGACHLRLPQYYSIHGKKGSHLARTQVVIPLFDGTGKFKSFWTESSVKAASNQD